MSDLLDRLEELKILQYDNGYKRDAQLISDASDEIESLIAEHGEMNEANVKYEKEIERLTAELKHRGELLDRHTKKIANLEKVLENFRK